MMRLYAIASSIVFFLLVHSLAHAGSVGSSESCQAIGGSLERRSAFDWAMSCWVKWLPKQCESEQGLWYDEPGRCLLPLSTADLVSQCKSNGGAWGLHGASVEHCSFEAERAQCNAQGGTWERL